MKIIGIADIHDRLDYPAAAIEQLRSSDLVLIAGDITNFGDKDEAQKVIQRIAEYNPRILAVPGNCDRAGVNRMISEYGMNLHGTSTVFGGVMFLGLGGCNKTLFHTPMEYADDEMTAIFSKFERMPGIDKCVLVTHVPPYKTKLDRIFIGLHVGSKPVRRFIERFQPDIALCGHIHEARGVDTLGKTVIINPGPFPKHYALLDLGEKAEYVLF